MFELNAAYWCSGRQTCGTQSQIQKAFTCRCRVWSVAHSALEPNWTASGADNGVVRLWHDRALRGGSTALIPARGAAVCGVEFCGEDANLLAVACADSCAYVFDLRNRCACAVFFVLLCNSLELYVVTWLFWAVQSSWTRKLDWSSTQHHFGSGSGCYESVSDAWSDARCSLCCSSEPLFKAAGHSRAVSYARFHGRSELITASVDSTVRQWRLDPQPAVSGSVLTPHSELRGHLNNKNFVGLSIHSAAQRPAGSMAALVACGSENGVAHVFESSSGEGPLATWRLDTIGQDRSETDRAAASLAHQQEFISSVCWQPVEAAATTADAPLLAVASSDGDLRLLKLH